VRRAVGPCRHQGGTLRHTSVDQRGAQQFVSQNSEANIALPQQKVAKLSKTRRSGAQPQLEASSSTDGKEVAQRSNSTSLRTAAQQPSVVVLAGHFESRDAMLSHFLACSTAHRAHWFYVCCTALCSSCVAPDSLFKCEVSYAGVCMYVCMNYIAVSTLWTLTPPVKVSMHIYVWHYAPS
jgi:hypothetical protein